MSGWIGAWGTTATVTDLTVTNSQVISVNTSTNALRITQTGSGNALLVEDDTNPDSSAFVITSSGNVGIGNAIPTAARTVTISRNITGGPNSTVMRSDGVIQSDVTGAARGFHAINSTVASSFVLTNMYNFYAEQGTIGASSSVTNQYGFFADASLTGATNDYGFYSNIAFAANRYNFYANGNADNFFAGNTYTASGTTTMTSGFFHIPAAAGAPTGVPTAVAGRVPMYYDTTNNNFYIYNGAWKKILLA